eukprot:scaffold171216_cov35-Attheya_sp.AAC.1
MTDTGGLFYILGALNGMDSPRTYNRGSKTIDFIQEWNTLSGQLDKEACSGSSISWIVTTGVSG